jgi:hypothetical protein
VELPGPSLWDLFADGARIATINGTTTAHTLDLGYLTLPTGWIVASDPFLDPWNEAFSVRVRPGAYLALLAVVQGDAASVMVYFGDGPPVSWRPADPPAFAVDSATGCLMDQKVWRFLRRRAEEDRYERYARRFREALDEADGLWANYCVDPESGANIILFRTWGGDGHFPSFFGYSGDGSKVCLVTDMYLSSECVVGGASA